MADFNLPAISQRVAIVGRTGTGKTQFGAWVLSHGHWRSIPYVIIDYKGDPLLNAIPYAREIGFKDKLGKDGIHIIHPKPKIDDDEMEAFLLRLWERENVGMFFDELYMIPDKGALQAILTQGRSKHLPVIGLSQRPSWLSKFVFTEADYFSVFHLNDLEDRKKIKGFVPVPREWVQDTDRLPEYNSHWYDVKQNALMRLLPVPDGDSILERFEAGLSPNRKVI